MFLPFRFQPIPASSCHHLKGKYPADIAGVKKKNLYSPWLCYLLTACVETIHLSLQGACLQGQVTAGHSRIIKLPAQMLEYYSPGGNDTD